MGSDQANNKINVILIGVLYYVVGECIHLTARIRLTWISASIKRRMQQVI